MTAVLHDFPGLTREKLPSGALRWRVRKVGAKAVRTLIPFGPGHPDLLRHYHAARYGEKPVPTPEEKAIRHSLQWLVEKYLAALTARVGTGRSSPLTLKGHQNLLRRLCDMKDEDGDRYGDCDAAAPRKAFIRARDALGATPGAADNMIKAARAAYAWGRETGLVEDNPVAGIPKIGQSKGGAVPWTAADIAKFRDAHPEGTTARLWLTLAMFTGCRIGDAIWIGRGCETTLGGVTWLRYQPRKKGSAMLEVPVLPPLLRALKGIRVVGDAYILSAHGRPYASAEALRNKIAEWCETAGLKGRSSHGVRKALAGLLAEAGCSQHQIMSVLSHTQARTSEVYTKGASRRILAADAMAVVAGLNWQGVPRADPWAKTPHNILESFGLKGCW